MTDQTIRTLIQQQRIETALEAGMLVLVLIAIMAGAVVAIEFLRGRYVRRVAAVFCVAALLALVSSVALDRLRSHHRLTIDQGITEDILALWR